MSEWEIVIGLEVHAQLTTQSKIFSGAATAFGAEPNTQACAVDLGLPGVLPVLNQAAVEKAIAFGLAVDAEIAPRSVFARKHYFYPDLPKGYQISQYELPVVGKGKMSIRLEDGSEKVIGITRAHLEEDAGKSIHDLFQDASAIDLNRAGTPLLEIVSEPDMRSASEAVAYLRKLHGLVVSLGICDGNMQEGSFRCDANVSVRKKGAPQYGTRTETKNLNSFKFVEKAINYEVERHIDILESGGKINQETRLFDSIKNETRALRSKEEANDYRYFPDPDLLPLIIHAEDIAKIKATLPELPEAKKARFMAQYQLSDYDAEIISSNLAWAKYYELLATQVSDYKLAANWLMGDLAAALNTHQIDLAQSPIAPADLADLINRIIDNTISGKIAKDIFPLLWNKTGSVDEIIEANGLKQVTDSSAIQAIIDQVIANNPKQLADYRSGKDKLFGFFVGQTMKAMQGKGNPDVINQLLKQSLAA